MAATSEAIHGGLAVASENSVHLTTIRVRRADLNPERPDCLAEVVGPELRNVVAKYPFERS